MDIIMDIHRNQWIIFKWITIKAQIIEDWYPLSMDIHLWIFIFHGHSS